MVTVTGVPWRYARKTVLVKADESVLYIYYDELCIARHALSRDRGKYIRNPEHLKGVPHAKDGRKEKYRHELSCFGEAGLRYFNELLSSSLTNPYHHMSAVLKLKDLYPVGDIVRSIETALQFKALRSKTIVNLVRRQIPLGAINRLERMLSVPGLDYSFQEVEQRPLEFYDWVTTEKG